MAERESLNFILHFVNFGGRNKFDVFRTFAGCSWVCAAQTKSRSSQNLPVRPFRLSEFFSRLLDVCQFLLQTLTHSTALRQPLNSLSRVASSIFGV